jgi:hypothetical protein
MWRRVALVRTDVPEERIGSIIRVKIISEPPNDGGDTFLRNVSSYKSYTASHHRRRNFLISCCLTNACDHIFISYSESKKRVGWRQWIAKIAAGCTCLLLCPLFVRQSIQHTWFLRCLHCQPSQHLVCPLQAREETSYLSSCIYLSCRHTISMEGVLSIER